MITVENEGEGAKANISTASTAPKAGGRGQRGKNTDLGKMPD